MGEVLPKAGLCSVCDRGQGDRAFLMGCGEELQVAPGCPGNVLGVSLALAGCPLGGAGSESVAGQLRPDLGRGAGR